MPDPGGFGSVQERASSLAARLPRGRRTDRKDVERSGLGDDAKVPSWKMRQGEGLLCDGGGCRQQARKGGKAREILSLAHVGDHR